MRYTTLLCDVLVDAAPRSGAVNMRLDEQMLQQVVEDGSKAVARVYRWDCPTVSLGYFQHLDAEIAPQLASCPRVRRITGGGAILHDQELTYSCVVPSDHPVRSEPVRLYELLHDAVITLLAEQGITASMRQHITDWKPPETSEDPFLCFLRSDARDVVIDGQKVLGSAQRRRRGNILQHGSILLRASSLTPNVSGICDLRPEFDVARFEEQLPEAIGKSLAEEFRLTTISD